MHATHQPTFAGQLDALADWRVALDQRVADWARWLADNELADESATQALAALRQRLQADHLIVAFVAEFSRGKSELINAIFFADTGQRILPATPGRTTMCPVEIGWHAGTPPLLALLPMETRLDGAPLAELRVQSDRWTRIRLDPADPARLAESLAEVMRTQAVSLREARALGLWNDDRPDDNPPLVGDGLVEVPAWRHAVINYPHPLLQRGLVILDTPGLNAIGAEPELTLAMLPTAHAIVFIVGADTGVTRSDLAIWRDHLGQQGARYVVLNKIDTLADPLLTPAQVSAQIEQQCRQVANTLELRPEQVLPLSARQALAARIGNHAGGVAASGLPALEATLAGELLPRRRELLTQAVHKGVATTQAQAARRLSDARRQLAERLFELRGLRGKSAEKVQLMIQRADAEAADFERCTARLAALRSVQARLLRETLPLLASEQLRAELLRMQNEVGASFFNLGAKKAFVALCERLRERIAQARARNDEAFQMLSASFRQLNTDYGFALGVVAAPTLDSHAGELAQIERAYVQYLGLGNALKLSEPRFMEQFRRMLLSKLRTVFENATGEVELWHKSASTQTESQLRERRRDFKRRREALQRVAQANGELEQRIAEIEEDDRVQQQLLARLQAQAADLLMLAEEGPQALLAPPQSPKAVLDAPRAAAA
jgi:hypothetical protein